MLPIIFRGKNPLKLEERGVTGDPQGGRERKGGSFLDDFCPPHTVVGDAIMELGGQMLTVGVVQINFRSAKI